MVNKPLNWTSFDVVNKLRYSIKKNGFELKKIGHAGTLDPLATGLLIICTGKMTKKINQFQELNKTYIGKMKLGITTPSYDLETEIDENFPIEHIDEQLIQEKIKLFEGWIDQVPPMFSAIKVDGKTLYQLARKGKRVEIKSRKVLIEKFLIENKNFPELDFEIVCSKGTYIRSLAHDFGKALNSGAVLTNLCRTKIGNYQLENAWNLEKLVEAIMAKNLDNMFTDAISD